MKYIKQVYDFSVKWLYKFKDPNISYIELVDHWLADDCETLGFEMDCGSSFSKKYGDAAYDYQALKKVIGGIADISLLGSAIYSRWRYFNHWAFTAEEILNRENRLWFITSLERLAFLSRQNDTTFNDNT